jgi:hypothetical protein
MTNFPAGADRLIAERRPLGAAEDCDNLNSTRTLVLRTLLDRAKRLAT